MIHSTETALFLFFPFTSSALFWHARRNVILFSTNSWRPKIQRQNRKISTKMSPPYKILSTVLPRMNSRINPGILKEPMGPDITLIPVTGIARIKRRTTHRFPGQDSLPALLALSIRRPYTLAFSPFMPIWQYKIIAVISKKEKYMTIRNDNTNAAREYGLTKT